MADFERRKRLGAAIRHSHPLDYLRFAPDDPLAPTPAQIAKIEEGWKSYTGLGTGTAFPVASLSTDMQAAVRKAESLTPGDTAAVTVEVLGR